MCYNDVGEKINYRFRCKIMGLSNKQINYYKPLIIRKLESLGVKSGIGYTKTGTKGKVEVYVTDENGMRVVKDDYTLETKLIDRDHYRATNLQKSITKKLLKLDVPQVERFLTTEPTSPKSEEILIEESSNETSV